VPQTKEADMTERIRPEAPSGPIVVGVA